MKESILVRGGRPLLGSVKVQGSKNSALPILAACVLADGVSVIENCPDLLDTAAMLDILEYIGCAVERSGHTVTVDSTNIMRTDVPDRLMHRLRSSIVLLGALLARTGRASMSGPGGCELGHRPIDLHLAGLNALGARARECGSLIKADCGSRRGGEVVLSFPSVGATENLMLFGTCCREGVTIVNAAREPEICDLAEYMNSAGFSVRGAGSAVVHIDAEKRPERFVRHRIISDRIAAVTWLCAVAVAGGEAELVGAERGHFSCVADILEASGCLIDNTEKGLSVRSCGRLSGGKGMIRTGPYPCFPTDAQPLVSTAMTTARGCTLIEENMFENRYSHLGELSGMGADIELNGRFAMIRGVDTLCGRTVRTHDLRGGAALVTAGLCALGETRILNIGYIDRGYECIDKTLESLGADIERVTEESEDTEKR